MKTFLSRLPAAAALVVAALGLLACSKESRVSDHLKDADRFYQQRQYERAKIEYINVLRAQNGTNAHAIQRIGRILVAQGQLPQAYPFLITTRNLFPEDLENREQLAMIYSRASGVTNRARLAAEVEEILKRAPDNETGVLLLAQISRTPEEVAQFGNRLKELRQKAGDRAIFTIAEAEILRRRGATNETEAAFKRAIAAEPKLGVAHQAYGTYLYTRGRMAEAEVALRTAAELAPPEGPARLGYARFLIEMKRFPEARAVLEEITTKAPERLTPWIVLAEVSLAEKKPDDAEKILTRVMAQAPEDPECLRVMAQVRLAQQKPAEAVKGLERVVRAAPRSSPAHYQLALAQLLARDVERAVTSLEEAIRLDPNNHDAVLLLAEINTNRGDAAEAIPALRDVITAAPRLERAYLQLIRAQRLDNRLNEALATALLTKQRFPTNFAAPYQMGLIYLQQRRLPEARASFEQVLSMNTNAFAAMEQLIRMDMAATNFPSALRRLEAPLAAFPQILTLWSLKAEIHVNEGNFPAAETALRKVLELEPGFQGAALNLAKIFARTERKKEALELLEQMTAKFPKEAGTWGMLATLYGDAGQHEKALKAYQTALELRPDNYAVLNNLAYLKAEQFGRLDEAQEYGTKARQLNPTDPYVADTLGWIEFRRGQYAEALRLLIEAYDDLSDSPEYLYHLGMAYYMAGNEESARGHLQRATRAKEEFNGKANAAEALAILNLDPTHLDPASLASLEKRRRETPKDVVVLLRLADAYEASGDFNKARDALEAALSVNNRSGRTTARLAEFTARRLNNPARALELARQSRTFAPTDPVVAQIAGRTALVCGDPAWSYTVLQDASRQLTNRADLDLDLAKAAFATDNLAESERLLNRLTSAPEAAIATAARQILDLLAVTRDPAKAAAAEARVNEALKADPNLLPALYVSGLVAEAQGRHPVAAQIYDQLRQRYPTFTLAPRQLVLLYADQLKDDAKAYDIGVKLRRSLPQDDAFAAALGKVSSRRGDHALAVQLLQQAARTQLTDATLFYQLGVSQQALNRKSEAKAALEKSVALDASAPFATDARQRIEKL